MACVPLETPSFELGPRDYLNEFLTLISTLRGGQAKYVPLLLTKIDDMLSTMAGPLIPPLIFKTRAYDDDNDRFEEIGENTSSSHHSLLPAPPTLSTSSSDMSDISLMSNDDPFSMGLAPVTGMIPAANPQLPVPAATTFRGPRSRIVQPVYMTGDDIPKYEAGDDSYRLNVQPALEYYSTQFT